MSPDSYRSRPTAARPARRTRRTRTAIPGAPLSRDTPSAALTLFNQAPPTAAEAALLACCGSHRWARRVAAHRPYPTLEALLAAADEAAYDLTPADLGEALAVEIAAEVTVRGPAGGSAGGPAPERGTLAVDTVLRAAHAAYEARFGHAFVIALEHTDPTAALDEILAGLRVRLGHDPDVEGAVTAEQLRRLARARLTAAMTDGDPVAAAARTVSRPA